MVFVGFYANSTLDLYVPKDKVEALREELIALAEGPEATVSLYDDVSTASLLISLLNEENGGNDDEVIGDEVYLGGWGGGKCFWSSPESAYDLIAKYGGHGTVDWMEDNDPDARWRIRIADGDWKNYGGVVTTVYPDDPYDKEG